MAPKKAPEPAPEPPTTSEPTGPAPVLIDGIAVPASWVKQTKGIELNPIRESLRERSANIRLDPKMKTLQTSDGKASASTPVLGRREIEQQHAREAQERHLRRLNSEATKDREERKLAGFQLPQPTRSVSEEMQALFEKGDREPSSPAEVLFKGRRENTTRLMDDIDLAQRTDLLKKSSPKLRCEHLDRVHGWYDNARIKDARDARARQERPCPNFMTFAKHDRTMSGSLRAEPHEKRYAPLPWDVKPSQKPAWLVKGMSKSASYA